VFLSGRRSRPGSATRALSFPTLSNELLPLWITPDPEGPSWIRIYTADYDIEQAIIDYQLNLDSLELRRAQGSIHAAFPCINLANCGLRDAFFGMPRSFFFH